MTQLGMKWLWDQMTMEENDFLQIWNIRLVIPLLTSENLLRTCTFKVWYIHTRQKNTNLFYLVKVSGENIFELTKEFKDWQIFWWTQIGTQGGLNLKYFWVFEF